METTPLRLITTSPLERLARTIEALLVVAAQERVAGRELLDLQGGGSRPKPRSRLQTRPPAASSK